MPSEKSGLNMLRANSGNETIKVLYIIGWGRSGSTLVDNILGELDGFFSAGELRNLWHEGLSQHRKCGCGQTVLDCPIWSEVLKTAFDSSTKRPPAHQILAWQRRYLRSRYTWRLIRSADTTVAQDSDLRRYSLVMSRIYSALAKVTDSRVIVDSSKVPSDAALLRNLPGVVPYYLHLVRDPRATAYSWRRTKARLDSAASENMPRFGLLKNSVSWIEFNLGAEAVRRHSSNRFMLLRYEDFVRSPRSAIRAIAEMVDDPPDHLPFRDERTAQLRGNHTVSGNPLRFRGGTIEIRDDNEWITGQPIVDQTITSVMTAPLLRRYGYAFRVRGKVRGAGSAASNRHDSRATARVEE